MSDPHRLKRKFAANTFVSPGKSTSVKLSTCGEYILRFIGERLMPLLFPAILAVSFSISRFTSLKLCESAIGYVVELGPFWLCSHTRGRVWSGRIVLRRYVDELEDERSSSYDAAATRQEVPADDVLEDRRLS